MVLDCAIIVAALILDLYGPAINSAAFEKIADLTLKNVSICPATFNIVEALRAKLK